MNELITAVQYDIILTSYFSPTGWSFRDNIMHFVILALRYRGPVKGLARMQDQRIARVELLVAHDILSLLL